MKPKYCKSCGVFIGFTNEDYCFICRANREVDKKRNKKILEKLRREKKNKK